MSGNETKPIAKTNTNMRTKSTRMSSPFRRAFACLLGLAALLILAGHPTSAAVQVPATARQVTLVGILATPGKTEIDDSLKPIEARLRRFLPNHGFKLLKSESKRLATGDNLDFDLSDPTGVAVRTQLLVPSDVNGNVQLRFELARNGVSQYQTIVTTPPNQIFFCDKMLTDNRRLVIGIGAR